MSEICKRLEDSKNPWGVISRQRRSQEGARRVWDEDFINQVREIVERSPTRSFRSMAQELEVDTMTIRACVNEDLKCRSYKMQTGQILDQAVKN